MREPEEAKADANPVKAAEKRRTPDRAKVADADKVPDKDKVKGGGADAVIMPEMKADSEIALFKKGGKIMPGLNKTGPMGEGAMTGGRRGLCNPANTEYERGYGANYGRGLGRGRRFQGECRAGRGYGFGRGQGFARQPVNAPISVPNFEQGREDELNMLKTQADSMQKTLDEINQRIASLGGNFKESDNKGATDDD